ncbi:MAG: (deoxy)nucleoside triphosphate pyrophosphohydrolase [Bacteroidaceae bacterium]|nr:(deoxy)nucleoside triphosphate pyrophosphohydrolase [Bacteroidaceae bacterium]
MSETKKTIRVVAAIITEGERILATQRGYGAFKGMWEFPGGKIEADEMPEQALQREIKEELQLEIAIQRFVSKVHYEYPDFILNMDCYLCNIVGGKMSLIEHQAAVWLTPEQLTTVEWLPADVELVEQLRQTMR